MRVPGGQWEVGCEVGSELSQFLMAPRTSLQEGRLSAKMTLRGKALRTKLDLRRYVVDKDPGWALSFWALTPPMVSDTCPTEPWG